MNVSTPNIFRPFRADHRVDVFLGFKPQAEFYSPFGTQTFFGPYQLLLTLPLDRLLALFAQSFDA
jgi:hypothetical protein